MFKIDLELGSQPRVVGQLDSLMVATHEIEWDSFFGWCKNARKGHANRFAPVQVVQQNLTKNRLRLAENADYSDLVAEYAHIMETHPEESEEPGVAQFERFYLDNAEALAAVAQNIFDRAQSTTKGFKSAKPLQKLVLLAKVASFVADEAHESIGNENIRGSLHNTLATTLAAALPANTFSDQEVQRLGALATTERDNLKRDIIEDKSTSLSKFYKLCALVNAINIYAAKGAVLRSARKIGSPVIESTSKDWGALADLYQEALEEHSGREPVEFFVELGPEKTGLKEAISIVFHCNDPEMTMFPVSGFVALSSEMQGAEEKLFEQGKNRVVEKYGYQQYRPFRATDVLNIPFTLHPGGEISFESLSNNHPNNAKNLLGDSYEMIRAQILYALGLETIARYKVQAPSDVVGPVGREIEEEDQLVLPHQDRKILLDPSPEEMDIDAAFEAAEAQLPASGRAHRRLLLRGKPSRRAYEFSQDDKENPSKIGLKACVVTVANKQHEWFDLPMDNWTSFSAEVKSIDEAYGNSEEHELRFHTFVRRPQGVESHSGKVKKAVVSAAAPDAPAEVLD